MAIPSETQRQADIRTIVGGNFTGDALGPTYDQILARVTGSPGPYLDTFERMFLAAPAGVTVLSRLYLPAFLKRVAPFARERVRTISQRLLSQLEASARVVDELVEQIDEADEVPLSTASMAENLDHRRRELRVLAGADA